MNNDLVGKTFGSWAVFSFAKAKELELYNCQCNKCGITHIVSKSNILAGVPCPTCPENPKSPVDDVIGIFGSMLGLTDTKKKDINVAFEKLNKPEFREVYSSLERASGSIKNVMSGNSGAPDVARKVLETELSNLKTAFNNLIKDGKITEEEARLLKTDINSSANMEKLKTMLEIMKQQTRDPKKTKI